MANISKKNKITSSILQASYKLLLCRNFHDISIADIEEETGFTRGTIFYYFDNKMHIFKEVIEAYYLIHFFDYNLSSLFSNRFDFTVFYNSYKTPFDRIILSISDFSNVSGTTNPARAFFHLTIQALAIYPDLEKKLKILHDKEYETISDLLLMKIKTNEGYDADKLNNMIKELYESSYSRIFKSAFLAD